MSFWSCPAAGCRKTIRISPACAVPVDAEGITIVARPAGRPENPAAKMSAKFAQAVGVAHFDNVFVPYDKVFIDGETEEAHIMTTHYAASPP